MVKVETVKVMTDDGIGFANVTPEARRVVRESGISNGTVTVQAGLCIDTITHMEFEPGSQQDLTEWLEKIVPTNAHYVHEVYNHDDNGHSHLRASLFGASETFVVKDGEILLNTWQQIVMIGFNPKGGNRAVHIAVMGE